MVGGETRPVKVSHFSSDWPCTFTGTGKNHLRVHLMGMFCIIPRPPPCIRCTICPAPSYRAWNSEGMPAFSEAT
jgi:hypothetical protein